VIGDQAISERIGVVVVHGISEQRRYEHVDGQVREIVAALGARPNTTVTVDVAATRASANQRSIYDRKYLVRTTVHSHSHRSCDV
jgi:hypothetical protein